MNELPRGARLYIFIVFGLGVIAALSSLIILLFDLSLVLPALFLAALIALFDLYPVVIRRHQVEVTLSTCAKFAAVLLLSSPPLLCGTFLGTLLGEWRMERAWYKKLFNIGEMTLTVTILSFVFHSFYQPHLAFEAMPNLLAMGMVGLSDALVTSVVVSLIIALVTRQRVVYTWAENTKPFLLQEMAMLALGLFVAVLWRLSPFTIIITIIPLFVLRYSYQAMIDLREQTKQALLALARVLDERDEATSQHCERVAEYAELIARELGLGPGEVEIITRAAWLHDIGKIGMRNDILFKPSPLTSSERELAKRHSIIGGELLKKFPLFEKGAVYVRHHHEHWDGSGYPDGLSGEKIPLGARILAVADAFQAMTDERPYRAPLSEEAALRELQRCAGTQFDPQVVIAFLRAKHMHLEDPAPQTGAPPIKMSPSPD